MSNGFIPPPASSRWWKSRSIQRLWHDRPAMVALFILFLLFLFVSVGPIFSPHTESEQNLAQTYAKPSASHWFGQDELGRDLFTRVMYGGRVSLAVGIVGALISVLLGVSVGGWAGQAGGRTEMVIMRLIDFLYGIPLLLIVIMLMVMLGEGLLNVFLALGMVYWLGMARVVRARVSELRSQEFVHAARALGASRMGIFIRHILPNTVGVIVVTATFMIPLAIYAESFLSFLGLGVSLPHASWGTLAADGLSAMRSQPHVLIFPSIAICLTMFTFQTFGEGLRAALDPHEAELD